MLAVINVVFILCYMRVSFILGLENSTEMWNINESDPGFKDQLGSYQISIISGISAAVHLYSRGQLLDC